MLKGFSSLRAILTLDLLWSGTYTVSRRVCPISWGSEGVNNQICYIMVIIPYYGDWLHGVHRTCLEMAAVSPGTTHVQNTEILLSMNNIEICLTTA